MPERLIRIGWYPRLQDADAQLQRLKDAGLDGYIGGESEALDEPVDLLVAESQTEAARALLGIEPEAEPPAELDPLPLPTAGPGTRRCPECHSTDVFQLPPYAGRVLLGSFVLLAATAAMGYAWVGGAGIMLGWVAALWLSRHSGHYRCRNCRREWKP